MSQKRLSRLELRIMEVLWKHALEEIRAKRAMPKPNIKYAKRKRKRLKTMGATS